MRDVVLLSLSTSSDIRRNGLSEGGDSSLMEGESLSVKPLHTQVGGHIGFLKLSDYVLKPLQSAQKGERERGFYESVGPPLSQFTPNYYGIVELEFPDNQATKEYIVLQDITKDFTCPTIMDIKIGRRTYGPDASASKIEAEDSKYTGTKLPFGLSFVSMFVYSLDSDETKPQIYDRNFGRKLKTEDIYEVPIIFFDFKSGFNVAPLINGILEEIKKIRAVFETQVDYNIFSSSLLIVYDTHVIRSWIKNPKSIDVKSAIRVKIIDFAHAHPGDGRIDINFLFGINSLISVLEKFMNSYVN